MPRAKAAEKPDEGPDRVERATPDVEPADREAGEAEVVGTPAFPAMTPAEVRANLDDGAVRADGRLHGRYLDDVQAEHADYVREKIEAGAHEEKTAQAAAIVRDRASQTGLDRPAEQLGQTPLHPSVSPVAAPARPGPRPEPERVLPDDRAKTQLGVTEANTAGVQQPPAATEGEDTERT
jgi:hypothetical protein